MKIKVNTGIEETSGEIIALRDFANLLKLKIIYMNTARQITLQTVSVNGRGLFFRALTTISQEAACRCSATPKCTIFIR